MGEEEHGAEFPVLSFALGAFFLQRLDDEGDAESRAQTRRGLCRLRSERLAREPLPGPPLSDDPEWLIPLGWMCGWVDGWVHGWISGWVKWISLIVPPSPSNSIRGNNVENSACWDGWVG